MYARSVGRRLQKNGRPVHIAAPTTANSSQQEIVPPPDYSGTALSVQESPSFEELFRDGTPQTDEPEEMPPFPRLYSPTPFSPQSKEEDARPRYPLLEQPQYDRPSNQNPPSQEKPWITHRRDNDRRTGLNSWFPLSIGMDDMLIVALIILLLANGSDEETILILAFLLLVK